MERETEGVEQRLQRAGGRSRRTVPSRHQHADGQPFDSGLAGMPSARLYAGLLCQNGTTVRMRPSHGQGSGLLRVAGRAAQGAGVVGRVGRHDAGRRPTVRSVHVHDVHDHVAQVRSVSAAVHAVAAVLRAVVQVSRRGRPVPVQKSSGRVPEVQGARTVPIRTAGPDGGTMAACIFRPNARAQQRYYLLRRSV